MRHLWLGTVLLKHFGRRAPNQQAVLAVFEEEGWPPRIDDPLPPRPGRDAKHRLREVVADLNEDLVGPLRFYSDGTGEGIRWEPLEPWTAIVFR